MIDITTTEVGKFIENLTTTDITRSEMKDILSRVNNPDMISFVSFVPEKMNQYLNYWIIDEEGKKKKNPNPIPNPFINTGIRNLSRKYQIVIGFDYVKSINRRLEKEGKEPNFVGGYKPRYDKEGKELPKREVWFDIISKGLVTDKKTHSKFYLRYQYKEGESTIGKPQYFCGDDPIEKQLFESYLVQKDYDSQYDNQGLDDYLPFQVCDLNNILYISMGGVHYRLID